MVYAVRAASIITSVLSVTHYELVESDGLHFLFPEVEELCIVLNLYCCDLHLWLGLYCWHSAKISNFHCSKLLYVKLIVVFNASV